MNLREVTDRHAWDAFVNEHSWGHPLQLWGWGEAKRSTNWTPYRLILDHEGKKAGAQVLLWPIPKLGRFIAYVPRGPVVEPALAEKLLAELVVWAKAHKALYLRVEPAWIEAELPNGWRKAANSLQMTETYTIDLTKTEDEILEPMARKHRQYIRKAERDGVVIERINSAPATVNSGPVTGSTPSSSLDAPGDGDPATGATRTSPEGSDLQPMYDLYYETASRAGFGIHSFEYYQDLHSELGESSYLYYASIEGTPVAFLWLAAAGATAYELYGGVSGQGQEAKANYYLKWHAIEAMKTAGFKTYDFNGRLNEGVSQFKAGFGPDETNYVGTYDYPFNLLGYHAWETLWPVAKPVGRKIMKAVKR